MDYPSRLLGVKILLQMASRSVGSVDVAGNFHWKIFFLAFFDRNTRLALLGICDVSVLALFSIRLLSLHYTLIFTFSLSLSVLATDKFVYVFPFLSDSEFYFHPKTICTIISLFWPFWFTPNTKKCTLLATVAPIS